MTTKHMIAAVLVCSCLAAASCPGAKIYEFVDYPALQNGYTLSGTIEVSDTAADDGMLSVEEILDWSWFADGLVPYNGRFRPDPVINRTPVRATGVEVDSQGIYLPATGESRLFLDDAFLPDQAVLGEFRSLSWSMSEDFAFYLLRGVMQGDIGFNAWDQIIPRGSSRSRWLLAKPIPEPFSVWLVAMATGIGYAGSRVWLR